MKKELILIIALMMILGALLGILAFNFSYAESIITGKISSQEKEYDLLWTKAICNESYCQDYEIKCKGNELVSQTPITGAVMEISSDWKDPRDDSLKNKLC